MPCFVFVFVGAPYVERLRGNRGLSSALAGVTAAVVGVIANLALFFAVHTLFGQVDVVVHGPLHLQVPQLDTLKPWSVAVAVLAAVALFRLGWSVLQVLGVCALLGLTVGVLQVVSG